MPRPKGRYDSPLADDPSRLTRGEKYELLADEAKTAEAKGLEWVGEATGMAQASGKVLVAASDRRKSDPSGRTINQLMKLSK